MAATHGLDEQAEQLKESLDENVNKIASLKYIPAPVLSLI
jgi:hypothetical protein